MVEKSHTAGWLALSSMDAPWKARDFDLRQGGCAVIYPAC
jgi:hypothetical protein